MSNRTQNAKKAKTASGHKHGSLTVFYLGLALIILFALVLISIVPQANSYGKVCSASDCLKVEYAATPFKRELGLSGRFELPEGRGMLFVFDFPDRQCMWMKDMKFNLDMVWISKDNKISKIIKGISPDTFPRSFCEDGAKYVLETNSGGSDILDLRIGDFLQL